MPVYKDEERGTLYVRCYYEDFTRKKKQIKKRGFKLQREAKEWEADFLRKQKGSTDMTFRSMYEIYIEDMGHRCRQSTIDRKKHVFEKLILPYFENKPINKITPKDIRAWQNEMIAKDYSNSYLDRMQNMITALFNYAVDYFNLAENPCHKAGRMGKREVVVNFWTKDEFDRILAAMEDDPTAYVSFSLLYYSGIRFGDDDDKIRLNQRKPSKYKGLRRFGPEKNLQRINKFMKERPIFYKNLIQMKENIRFYLRCFYCITKVMILQFNSENRTELARNG